MHKQCKIVVGQRLAVGGQTAAQNCAEMLAKAPVAEDNSHILVFSTVAPLTLLPGLQLRAQLSAAYSSLSAGRSVCMMKMYILVPQYFIPSACEYE